MRSTRRRHVVFARAEAPTAGMPIHVAATANFVKEVKKDSTCAI